MSTNDPARPLSRRLLLSAGTSAVAVAAPLAAPALAAGPGPAEAAVEELFGRWRAVQDEMAAATGYTDEWIDGMDNAATALEASVRACEPSLMKIGALALFALRYGIFFLNQAPADLENDDNSDADAIFAMAVLPAILPSLRGQVREVAVDFLAHPDREVRHSLLFQGPTRLPQREG